jgi:hypothetical protein
LLDGFRQPIEHRLQCGGGLRATGGFTLPIAGIAGFPRAALDLLFQFGDTARIPLGLAV